MKITLILIGLILTLSSCNPVSQKHGILTASLDSISDGTVLNIFDIDSNKVFREVIVKNGKFEFEFNLQEPRFYEICGKNQKYPKDVLRIWLENSEIRICGNYYYLFKAKTDGSKSNEIYEQFMAFEKGYQRKLYALKFTADTTANEIEERNILTQYGQIDKQYKIERFNLYSELIESEVTLYYLAFETTVTSVFSKNDIEKLYNKLPEKLKSSLNGELVKEFLSLSGSTPKVGEKFIDCTQLTPEGKPESISSHLGKYTIIDFWASWCGPCRAEFPLLKKIYTKYHDKGLNIINISGDNKLDAWKKAIKDDSIPWTNISDLKGWHNKAFMIYNIKSIPEMILLDENGIVIDDQLRHKNIELEIGKFFNSAATVNRSSTN
jgi:thiol-disulfide isomerase/thioredoxin